MAQSFKETAHLKTDTKKYQDNYDQIDWGKTGEQKPNLFVDKYGQYNVKECINGEPSGNDGLIISAYALKAGLPIDCEKIASMIGVLQLSNNIPIERFPGKESPTPSRDFFLGGMDLRLIHTWPLKENGWNFCPYFLPNFNLFKFIYQAWKIRDKHRNTMWNTPGYEQIWHIGYMTPFQDRAFLLRAWNMDVPLFYRLYEWIDKKLGTKSDSGALIRWLKYDIDPGVEVFERYFGLDHPITKSIKEKDNVAE